MKQSSPIPWTLALSQKAPPHPSKTIGVLSLQGDFLEHMQTLKRLGVKTREVRLPKDLDDIDGLIIPGGESTTIANLLDVFGLRKHLMKRIKSGLPIWGTCAGAILLAKKLTQGKPIPLGVMDIVVNRNAFGRQLESFEEELFIKPLGGKTLHATFIRAPIIEEVGRGVEILAQLNNSTIVAARQHAMLVTCFHPELTSDTRLHEYFLSLIL